MLDELLDMSDGRRDERGRGDGPAQRGGIRGFLSRILGGDEGDDERAARRHGCCAGDDGDGARSQQTSGRATGRRGQDQRDGDFDVGD